MKPILLSLSLAACTAEPLGGVATSDLNVYADVTRDPSGQLDVFVELGTYDAALDKNYIYLEPDDRLTAIAGPQLEDLAQHGPVLGVVQYRALLAPVEVGANVEIELARAATGETLLSEGTLPAPLVLAAPREVRRDTSLEVAWTGGEGAEDVELTATSSCARISTTSIAASAGAVVIGREHITVTPGAALPCELMLRATAVARGTTDPRLDDWWFASGFFARQVTEQLLTITE